MLAIAIVLGTWWVFYEDIDRARHRLAAWAERRMDR